MNAIAPRRKGWCPGALRPMETGDGLLARVRAPRRAACRSIRPRRSPRPRFACGNGAIGLSARGNLQLRGVSERDAARPAGAPRRRRAHRRRPRGRAAAQHRREPARATSIPTPCSTSGRASPRWRRGSARTRPAPAAGEVQLRPRRARAPAARRRRCGHPLRGVAAKRRFGDLSRRRRRARRATARPARPARSRRGSARAFVRLAGAGEGVAAADARARRARRGRRPCSPRRGSKREPRARSQRRASLGDVLGAHVFGAAIVVGAAAAFGEIEAGRFQGADRARADAWRERAAAHAVAGLLDRRPRAARPPRRWSADAPSSASSPTADEPRLRVAACPGAPACLHGHRPSARGRGALGGACCRRARASCCMSAAAPRDAPGRLRPRSTLTATEMGYDLVLAGKAGDPPARRGLSSARIEALLAAEGASLFAGERPSP